MDEEHIQKSNRGGIAAMVIALPIFYVLSLGPVVLIAKKHDYNGHALKQVYAPVIWLHDHTFLKKSLEAYVGFWEHLGA